MQWVTWLVSSVAEWLRIGGVSSLGDILYLVCGKICVIPLVFGIGSIAW